MPLLIPLVLRNNLIREKRLALGMTQEDAATRAKMNGKQAWSSIEKNEKANITLKTLGKIARVLKCQPRDLID